MEVFVLREYQMAHGWGEPIINISIFTHLGAAQQEMQSLIDMVLDGIEDRHIASMEKHALGFHFERADIEDVVDLVIDKYTINEEVSYPTSVKKEKTYWPGEGPEGE